MAKIQEAVAGGMWKATAQGVLGSAVTSGIVAHAGGTQAAAITDTASWLTGVTNVVATCATSGDSALLPKGEAGDEIWVRNNGAAPCSVYPQTGGNINNAGVNAAFSVTNAKTATFKNFGSDNWVAVLSA